MSSEIQMLNRAFSIIECLGNERGSLGVTEISEKVGIHKSSVYRILSSLTALGYAKKSEPDGKYSLSLKFVQLSSILLGKVELKTEAYPHMQRLANMTRQSVHLCVLHGNEAMYLEKVEAFNLMRMYSQIGRCVPLYCTGIGKMLLAGEPEDSRSRIIKNLQLEPRTQNTITDKTLFEKEIREVAERGYAIDNMENEEGIRCIAYPIKDYTGRVIAALSAAGNADIMVGAQMDMAQKATHRAAQLISEAMGYHERQNDCQS
ncbi:MAG: IclR family transcriptional regulator [Christensenellales bacterium]